MLYRRFEQLIDIFRDAPSDSPPGKVWPFYLYYLRQVWPSFLALLVVGLFGWSIVALWRPETSLVALRERLAAAGVVVEDGASTARWHLA